MANKSQFISLMKTSQNKCQKIQMVRNLPPNVQNNKHILESIIKHDPQLLDYITALKANLNPLVIQYRLNNWCTYTCPRSNLPQITPKKLLEKMNLTQKKFTRVQNLINYAYTTYYNKYCRVEGWHNIQRNSSSRYRLEIFNTLRWYKYENNTYVKKGVTELLDNEVYWIYSTPKSIAKVDQLQKKFKKVLDKQQEQQRLQKQQQEPQQEQQKPKEELQKKCEKDLEGDLEGDFPKGDEDPQVVLKDKLKAKRK